MKFIVKDYDQLGKHETLGLVHVPPKTLYFADGERMEFKLQPVPGKTKGDIPGYLAIRCRRATTHDKNFMESIENSFEAIAAPKMPKTANNVLKSMTSRTTKVENGIKKVSACFRSLLLEDKVADGYVVQSTSRARSQTTRRN